MMITKITKIKGNFHNSGGSPVLDENGVQEVLKALDNGPFCIASAGINNGETPSLDLTFVTIGLEKRYNHPEILITGLDVKTASKLIMTYYEQYIENKHNVSFEQEFRLLDILGPGLNVQAKLKELQFNETDWIYTEVLRVPKEITLGIIPGEQYRLCQLLVEIEGIMTDTDEVGERTRFMTDFQYRIDYLTGCKTNVEVAERMLTVPARIGLK